MKTLTPVLEDVLAIIFPEDTTNGIDGDDWSAASFEPAVQRLLNRVALLKQQAAPLGSVLAWAGNVGAVPTRYLLCDGQAVSRATYATLFATIGTAFGAGDGTTTFNLPDLRDRFVMGASAGNVVGANGGANAVTLSKAQMPSHNHTATLDNAGSHNHTATISGGAHGHHLVGSLASGGSNYYGPQLIQVDDADDFAGGPGVATYGSPGPFVSGTAIPSNAALGFAVPPDGSDHSHTAAIANAGSHTHTVTVADAGNDTAHENRPAFVALAYIIRAS